MKSNLTSPQKNMKKNLDVVKMYHKGCVRTTKIKKLLNKHLYKNKFYVRAFDDTAVKRMKRILYNKVFETTMSQLNLKPKDYINFNCTLFVFIEMMNVKLIC